jgi:hypothetical protein
VYVKIAGPLEQPTVTVEEGDDCTRLHVIVEELDEVLAGTALTQAGLGQQGTRGHILLDIAALRSLSRSRAPDWETRFDTMIEYAKKSGWVSADEKLVTAHIADAP